jgi:RNA-directed DNA polymerase
MPLQSDLSPARVLDDLVTDGPWVEAVEAFRARNPRRRDRLAAYQALLDAGEHRRAGADVLAERYRPAPPAECWLNKADGRKKRVFLYPPLDELLFRVLNRGLQPMAAEVARPWCRSFVPGGGPRAAFRTVLTDRDIDAKSALRIDVRDYFNSIDVTDLLTRLPEPWADGPLGTLLTVALLDPRIERGGTVVHGGRKGVMAGTPMAPLLATLYLTSLDREIADGGTTYARYSDDILVLAPPAALPGLERLVRHRLAERGLQVNEAKSGVALPGEPWDFLGFRYERGLIGLAPRTERKLKMKTTRLARSLLRWRERGGVPRDRTAEVFFRRTNRRLYGTRTERAHFSWATWFLPLLDLPDPLRSLDEHMQREVRYAATGRRTARTRQLLPYSTLVAAHHLPLVSAYWAMRQGVTTYEQLVAGRAGLG